MEVPYCSIPAVANAAGVPYDAVDRVHLTAAGHALCCQAAQGCRGVGLCVLIHSETCVCRATGIISCTIPETHRSDVHAAA